MTSFPKITYKQWGGKASLAKWVVSHLPDHQIYLEPFCGSAAVFLAKPRSRIEILNDLDNVVMTMWRAIQSQPQELAALLWATPYAQANWRDMPPPSDIEEAVILISQGAQFYSGNGNTSTWSLDKCQAPHKDKAAVWYDWFQRILPAANRLRGAVLLHEDANSSIRRVYQDGPSVLIYVDPPYVGHEDEYRFRVDYRQMSQLLHEATAKVVVSEYAAGEEFFPGWRKIERETASRAGTGAHKYSGKKKTEMLFCNF